jgi:excisionase family DNA binding protein
MLTESRGTSAVLDKEAVRPAEPEMTAIKDLALVIDRAEPTRRPALLGPDGEKIELPESVFRLLRLVLEHLRRGESVSIMHAAEELTTQQAADLLNVSRPYLVRLVDRGDIPAHKVGTHRRISRLDVEHYRAKRDSERRLRLRRMVRDAEDGGLYDLPEISSADLVDDSE